MDAQNKPRERRLAEVVREIKIAEADRLDEADRGGEGARARLELLVDELEDVFEEAGGEEAGFDFRVSSGATPRLWIDAATHVGIAADGETYRILRDGRGGRMRLGETASVDDAADIVTRYVATRSLERERLLDGPAGTAAASAAPRAARSGTASGTGAAYSGERTVVVRKPSRFVRFVRAILWFALGALAGAGALFIAYGERLGFENPVPLEYRGLYEGYVPALPGEAVVPTDELPEGALVPADDAVEAQGADDPNVEIVTPDEPVRAAPDAETVPLDGDGTATVGGDGSEPAENGAAD